MNIKKILLYLIIVVFIITYFIVDCTLFNYGMSKYNICKNELPMNLTPDFWDSDVGYPIVGFTIKNKYGIVLIAKGELFYFNTDTIYVNRILRYGYNNKTLIVVFEDINNNYFYVDYYNNLPNNNGIEFMINRLQVNKLIGEKDYEWVDVSEFSVISRLKMTRAYSGVIILGSCLIILILLVRNKKRK